MGQPQGICGIELGKDTLSVVHYLPSEDTITSVALQSLSDSPLSWWDNLRAELKVTLRDTKSGGRSLKRSIAVCSLPAEHAVVTRLMIDSNEASIGPALRWELQQQLIGSLEDYSYDFHKVQSIRPGPVTSYLAAACRGSWALKARGLLRAHGLIPRVLDLDVFALVNAFEVNYRDMLSAPAILLLGGEFVTKVVLSWNGGMIDFEQCRFNPDTQDAAEYVSTLRRTIERLRASYPSLAARGPLPMFASGVIFTWDAIAAACFQTFSELQMLNPFRNVGCTGLAESEQRQYAPRLGVAVGLALREASELDA